MGHASTSTIFLEDYLRDERSWPQWPKNGILKKTVLVFRSRNRHLDFVTIRRK